MLAHKIQFFWQQTKFTVPPQYRRSDSLEFTIFRAIAFTKDSLRPLRKSQATSRERTSSRAQRSAAPRRAGPGMLPIRWRLVIAPRRERCGTAQSCCWFIRLNSFGAPRGARNTSRSGSPRTADITAYTSKPLTRARARDSVLTLN